MEKNYLKKLRIAIVGPECSGKSTLAHYLSDYFQCPLIDEYARSYVQQYGQKSVNYFTILDIARIQFFREQKLYQPYHIMIVDTEILVCKVWCEWEYQQCHQWIEDQWKNNPYDLYILTYPDISYQEDKSRYFHDNPKQRIEVFLYMKKLIQEKKYNHIIVEGSLEKRVQNIISLLKTKYL